MTTTTYVALDAKDSIQTVRLMPTSELGAAIDKTGFVTKFNGLASANNIRDLLEAIDNLPPILPCETLAGQRRFFKPSDIGKTLNRKYRECDPESLQYQAHFDAGMPEEKEARDRATIWTIRHRSAVDGELHKQIMSASDEDEIVVVEPLDDWVMARNVLGLTARLMGELSKNAEKSGSPTILEDAGMLKTWNERLEKELFMIPFCFNPFFLDWKLSKESLAAKWSTSNYRPLTALLLGNARRERSGAIPFYLLDFTHDQDVYLATEPVARDRYHKLFESKASKQDRRYWLCVEERGRSQRELAEHIVISMVQKVEGLKYGDQNLGWQGIDETSIIDGTRVPKLTANSLFAQLMYGLIYDPDLYITNCKTCKNAILDTIAGKQRRYCSESCRQRLIRENREQSGVSALEGGR